MSKENRDLIHETVYHAAQAKGALAGAERTPTPMVVEQHENMADDNSPVQESWFVSGGVCGFAWIIIRPGGSSFARWLKTNGHGKRDSYTGGVSIWINQYGQSYERKVAHARAMVKYLRDVGINARTMSRLD